MPKAKEPSTTHKSGTSAAHPDAPIISLAADHIRNLKAFNAAPSELDGVDDSLWHIYQRSKRALLETRPQTIAGVVAKAQAAEVELHPDDCCGPVGGLVYDVICDLLKVHGGLT